MQVLGTGSGGRGSQTRAREREWREEGGEREEKRGER